jgi:hypothetical protein
VGAVVEDEMKGPTAIQERAGTTSGFNRACSTDLSLFSLTPRFSEVPLISGDQKAVSTAFNVAEGCRG